MLKKHAQLFLALLWLFDMAMLATAFAAAYMVREFLPAVAEPVTPFTPSAMQQTLELFALSVPVWSSCFYFTGLYKPRRMERHHVEIRELAKGTALSVLVLVFVQYIAVGQRYSRGVILLYAVISFLLLSVTRLVARNVLASLRAKGFNHKNALVLGVGDLSSAMIERLRQHPEFGIRIAGVLGPNEGELATTFGEYPIIGRYDELIAKIRETKADQIYIALAADEHSALPAIHQMLRTELVDVRVVPDVLGLITLRGGVEDIDGLPVVRLQSGPLVGVDAWLKRGFDLVFGSMFLALVSPVMIACALGVKLSSRGPVLFKQERVGLDGRAFRILKFRSMPLGAEDESGPVWAKPGEQRAFWWGRVMRKFSLDELPQFLNVLTGHMSLVGPRPERQVFIDELKYRIPRYNLRHKIKAGITGLAQVEGWRGDTSIEKRIERDLYYIEHWSLWLDLKILVRTAFGGFMSRNAY